MGKANYWFAFFADFATAMFFLTWEVTVKRRHFPGAALGFGAGFVLWGLTEYVFHRWVYHQPEGIFGTGHTRHHTQAEVLIAMPWFMTTLTMLALWLFCSWVVNIPYFSCILAGWLVGFVWYSLVHHSHHHWSLRNAWIRRLKAYHRVHHHFPDYNYGVTMRMWDWVFGTVYRKTAPVPERVQQVETEPVLADA